MCDLLAEYLHADRVFFIEANVAEGVGFIGPNYRRDDLTSLSGRYALGELPRHVHSAGRVSTSGVRRCVISRLTSQS